MAQRALLPRSTHRESVVSASRPPRGLSGPAPGLAPVPSKGRIGQRGSTGTGGKEVDSCLWGQFLGFCLLLKSPGRVTGVLKKLGWRPDRQTDTQREGETGSGEGRGRQRGGEGEIGVSARSRQRFD